jgi:hypothetical protein
VPCGNVSQRLRLAAVERDSYGMRDVLYIGTWGFRSAEEIER